MEPSADPYKVLIVDDTPENIDILGEVDYITKPISPAIGLARVKTHLELKQAREFFGESERELGPARNSWR